jgi:cystathionine gamma-synthase
MPTDPVPPRPRPAPSDAQPDWAIDTALVHLGRPARMPGEPLNVAIEAASAYHAGGEFDYARDGTRGSQAFESALGGWEGGHALAFSSGMAAANALLDTIDVGNTLVIPRHAYTGVAVRAHQLAEAGRIRLRVVDIADTDAVAQAAPGAHMIWVESPTNPMLEIADIEAIADIAARHHAVTVCDNTFATPMAQRPLDLGADVVLHSATKMIGGHSDLLAGALIFADADERAAMIARRTLLGGFPGALECFLALRGARTLALRWRQAQRSAQILAERLHEHPAIAKVRYPGLPDDPGYDRAQRMMAGPGTILAIEFTGGTAAARALSDRVRVWVHATSLGGVESLLERRRRWSAESDLVPEDLVRLSVGIEDVEDLWTDLAAALERL